MNRRRSRLNTEPPLIDRQPSLPNSDACPINSGGWPLIGNACVVNKRRWLFILKGCVFSVKVCLFGKQAWMFLWRYRVLR
ncbi:hypothetical protein ACQE3E_19115 [Methylomonas sp. MED-D]|uniref:hypothetical protein n=1 Tax=unclassified Methylomonas TaxID=2608980 RepID=UPI0028A496D5|nr:hypothetical protein [Methylomonas sp. MV1]MDT4332444.1 hypothetical protein [Methylomonas sp. MV1]